MPINNEYKRYFIILQEDSKNYGMGSGKTPAGYVKIEVKNGSCKLSTFVQNMKADKNLDYKLLMVSPVSGIGLEMGRMLIDSSGRGELNSEVNPNNVMNSGYNISEFTVAAVYEGDRFPLSGYLGRDKVNWKGKYSLINRVMSEESRPIENRVMPAESRPAENRVMPAESGPAENRVMPAESRPVENRVMPAESRPAENRVMPAESRPIENRVMPAESGPTENRVMPAESRPAENRVMPAESGPVENRVMDTDRRPPENLCEELEDVKGIDYKCYDMCENQSMEAVEDKCDYEMLRGVGRALRKLPRCRPFHENEWECFRIEDNMKHIHKASIRYCGQTIPMSYPLLKDDFLMKHLNDCMIGVKYDETGENIRHLMYAIPGDNIGQLRRYYGDIGFTDYRDGYYLMYIDI